MTAIPSAYFLKSLDRGLITVNSAVPGDRLLSISDDMVTPQIATVTAVSSVTEPCIKLNAFLSTQSYPVDAYVIIKRIATTTSVLASAIDVWDLLKLFPLSDLGQGTPSATAYDDGAALLYGTDTTSMDLASKYAFLAGMFDSCGTFYDDKLIFRHVDQDVVDKAIALCFELTGAYYNSSTYYTPLSYGTETARGKSAQLLLEGMASYLRTIVPSELSFGFSDFTARAFKTNTVTDTVCTTIDTDVGGYLVLSTGVAIK